MAEPKKPAAKSKAAAENSAAGASDAHVIEGAAIEKPTPETSVDEKPAPKGSAPKMPAGEKPVSAASSGAPPHMPVERQIMPLLVAGTALVFAVVAFAVSVTTYWQFAKVKTSTVAEQDMPTAAAAAPATPDAPAITDMLAQLAEQIAANTQKFASLQQDIAALSAAAAPDQTAPDQTAPDQTTPDQTTPDQNGRGFDAQKLADLLARLAALESVAKSADQAPSAATPAPELTSAPKTAPLADAQLGVLVAAGLLAENLAGRPIDKWVALLDDLRWPGLAPADREVIRAAGRMPVESRASLLGAARPQLVKMTQALHKADDDAGPLDRARASLGALVQLRRVDQDSDRPAAIFATFQAALNAADFDAALAAATAWSSAGLTGLEAWLEPAVQRQQLDAAVNAMVAGLLQQTWGQD
jgi:hypothetical protein